MVHYHYRTYTFMMFYCTLIRGFVLQTTTGRNHNNHGLLIGHSIHKHKHRRRQQVHVRGILHSNQVLVWSSLDHNSNDSSNNGKSKGSNKINRSKRSYENVLNEMYAMLYSTSSAPKTADLDDNNLIILQHSGYTAHVVTKQDNLTLREVLDETIKSVCFRNNRTITEMTSVDDLTSLGSIWYLPPGSPRDPALGIKPSRYINEEDDVNVVQYNEGSNARISASSVLDVGTYLRVHHTPRRFPVFHRYDWGKSFDKAQYFKAHNNELPGVVVGEDVELGYRIIMKPEDIPVHATVDNALENVAIGVQKDILKRQGKTLSDLRQQRIYEESTLPESEQRRKKRKQKVDPLIYVSTPQRLDHDTAGLLAVATKPEFAAYFAKLLRSKTDWQVSSSDQDRQNRLGRDPISKKYKCVVCISPETNQSMFDELNRLQSLQSNGTLVVHYLEPSIRAPKKFSSHPENSTWSECLLEIINVSKCTPIRGSNAETKLATNLWGDIASVPDKCVAVAEVEVNLLTGRTHQIRGQLYSLGFPLVGDILYGGAKNTSTLSQHETPTGYHDCERLALQCCELSFFEPEVFVGKRKEKIEYKQSHRLLSWRIEDAWWTSAFDICQESSANGTVATTSADDGEKISQMLKYTGSPQTVTSVHRSDFSSRLPLRVSLEPGTHKYVLIKAEPNQKCQADTLYFVKSASPSTCGGPYHADVAHNLIEDLVKNGYHASVIGGGRIDFDETVPHAHIFGFRYGFGKGNHTLVAQIIEEYTDVYATVNDQDGLY